MKWSGTILDTWAPMRTCAPMLAWLAATLFGPGLAVASAQDARSVPLAERARGAERVIVGSVTSVNPVWQVNEFGDRLIVSVVRVAVNETLKGPSLPTMDVDVEGGTLDGVTLRVSDQTSFAVGERAVFYLRRNVRGRFVPHLRSQGTLKLDQFDRVPENGLTLETIRREVAAGGGR